MRKSIDANAILQGATRIRSAENVAGLAGYTDLWLYVGASFDENPHKTIVISIEK